MWIHQLADGAAFDKYFFTILAYSLSFGFSITIAFLLVMIFGLWISYYTHNRMIFKVLHAPLNLFFDKTPSGTILNKFSKDLEKLDDDVLFEITFTIECLTWVLAVFYIGAMTSLWVLAFVPIVILFGLITLNFYIRSFRELTRLESATNSPVITHMSESISGVTTIRAFGKVQEFERQNMKKLNSNLKASFWQESLMRWFGMIMNIISMIMMISTISFCIAYRNVSSDPVIVGLLLIYLNDLQFNLF